MKLKTDVNLGNLSDLELGWLAGIIDGEGSIGLYKSNSCYSPRIIVVMVDKNTVERLFLLTGLGSLNFITGRSGNKDLYSWSVQAIKEVSALLCKVSNLLITKKRQASTLLHYCLTKELYSKVNEEKYYLELKGLNS